MILATLEDLKKYVSLNASGDIEALFRPYINLSIADYIEPYAGDIATLLNDLPTGEHAAIKTNARNLLEEALSNFGVYRSLSAVALHVTEYGLSVNEGTNSKPAESWRIKDFKRDLLNNGYSAVDRLLRVLNANPLVFVDYNSAFAKANKSYIITSATDFDLYQNINSSAITYDSLKPIIKEVIDRYLSELFCEEYLESLQSTTLEGDQLKAQNHLKKAIAAFTISHATQFSCFKTTTHGFLKRYDVLPYEQVTIPTAQEVRSYSLDRNHVGNAYINKAIDLIKSAPTSFTQCSGNVLIDTTNTAPAPEHIYNTKSTLQL